VVDLEVFDLAAAELAALLVHVQLEAVLDRIAERGVGAGVWQHEAHLDLVLGMRAERNCRGGDGGQRAQNCAGIGSHRMSPPGVDHVCSATKAAIIAASSSGFSRCGEWPQSASTSIRVAGTRCAMPSICASVPYSSR